METKLHDGSRNVLDGKFWFLLLAGSMLVFLYGAIFASASYADAVPAVTSLSILFSIAVTIVMGLSFLALGIYPPQFSRIATMTATAILTLIVFALGTQFDTFTHETVDVWFWTAITIFAAIMYICVISLTLLRTPKKL